MQRAMELFRLLAMLLAVGCMIVSLLGVGGAFVPRLDIFNHFAPVTLAFSIVAAAIQVAFWKTRETATLVCAVIAILVSAGAMTPELLAKAVQFRAAPGRQTVKVVELNLWSENVDLAGTARWLAGQHADVVVLEEVVANSAVVPELVKRVYPYHTDCDPDVPCTTAILSRQRPTARGSSPGRTPGGCIPRPGPPSETGPRRSP